MRVHQVNTSEVNITPYNSVALSHTLESRIIGGVGIIGGLDIVIIINNRGFDGVEKIVQAVS